MLPTASVNPLTPRVVIGEAVMSIRSNFTVESEKAPSELQPVNSINSGKITIANSDLKYLFITIDL
ncbi:hypothetical protein PLEI_3436 [Photobacterium leiognathi lrivu.4.1]|uniref:Uncharacterized protein n=1 Tax=Photobacterium leiognathi lrivu.4.1 TaxID=1248232 RepID=V5F6Q8_PHOLE|nr:hypothetical protein PLEI_3436 [Photobacterium leiognathi lrivu.4.1]